MTAYPLFKTFLFFNNYFHDFSAGLLLSSGLVAYLLYHELEKERDISASSLEFFMKAYYLLSRVALFSLVFIFIGGIFRTLSYKTMEWSQDMGKAQIPLLIIKHLILFSFAGAGCFVWLKLRSSVKALQKNSEEKEREKTCVD